MIKSARFIGSVTLAVGAMLAVAGTGVSAYASTPAVTASASTSSSSGGYLAFSTNGSVSALAGATNYGSAHTSAPIVGGAAVPGGGGYWLVASDGTVYTFGDAKSYGDTYTDGLTGFSGDKPLNAPIVGMAVTPNGGGYWLVAADGGIFNFGDAPFLGSTYTYGVTGLSGKKPLNAPITAIVSTPDGDGYWLIAKDGGVFDFGKAPFLGSTYSYGLTGLTGSKPLNAPIIGAIATPSGQGYYMVAADGGVFDFGDAHFEGSAYDLGYTGLGGKNPLPAPVSSLMVNPNGSGYYALCKNGTILAIGGAPSLPPIRDPGSTLVGIMPASPPKAQAPNVTPNPQPKSPNPQPKSPNPTPQTVNPLPPSTPYIPPAPSTPPLSITTTSASLYPLETSGPLFATGGNGSYRWSTTSPYFVATSTGIAPNPSDPPTVGTTYSVPVTVTSDGESATATISVTILAPYLGQSTISGVAVVGQATTYGSLSLATGLEGSGYTFKPVHPSSWSSEGLTLSSSGTVSGTLTGGLSVVHEVDILANGVVDATVPVDLSLSAPAAPVLAESSVTVYPATRVQLSATGGDGQYTYTELGLPSYLTMTQDGIITVNSGQIPTSLPTTPATFDVTITSDGVTSSSQTVTVTVGAVAPATDSFTAPSSGTIDQALTIPSYEGGNSAYTFVEGNQSTWSADGLALSSAGVITGNIGQGVSGLDVDIEDGTNVIVGTASISFTLPVSYTINTSSDSNWAGLVADTNSASNAIAQAGGTFTVPTLASTQPTICTQRTTGNCTMSTWVGIDGDGTDLLIQAGVESTYTSVGPSYQAWYEVITPNDEAPETPVTLMNSSNVAEPVGAGDKVAINIFKTAAHTWSISIDDLTTGATYTEENIDFPASISAWTSQSGSETAEWVNESTDMGGIPDTSFLCENNPYSPPTQDPTCSDGGLAIIPLISAGGNFTNMTSTTSAPYAYLVATSQNTISNTGYNLAANGDGLFTPTLASGQSYTLGSLNFTQSPEIPSAPTQDELSSAPSPGARIATN